MQVSYTMISKLCREESAGPIFNDEAILKIVYYLIIFNKQRSNSPYKIGMHFTIDLGDIDEQE